MNDDKLKKSSGYATTSFVLGIASFLLPPLAILSIIFGIVALRDIKKENLGGKGFALTGVILGAIVLLLVIAYTLYVWFSFQKTGILP